MKRKVTCPRSGQLVEIGYHTSCLDGHILGVETCSAFEPKDDVTCDHLCAKLLNEALRPQLE